ncbi:L,D-transpeptidase family protein [Brevibacterium luteolum]|nr:L,D-transpeptidase family protein [Brevibacterium luteolum]
MPIAPKTVLPAAVLTAAALLVSGCGAVGSANAQAAAEGAPVAAESVGSSLSAPQLQSPGDFPAPAVQEPIEPNAADSAPGGEASSSTDDDAVVPADGIAAGQTFPTLPGVGPETRGEVPDTARQVLVAIGEDAKDTRNQLVLYQRADVEADWEAVKVFSAHNGRSGWAEERREGDGTTPVGVFALTDAGGAKADPNSKLPYTQNSGLRDGAAQVYGEDWRDVFDYVIAINYNRKAGTAPTDNTRPMGWDAGGKIWLHVDHDSPTRGCVTVPTDEMQYLLQTIDPELDPHIVMGPADLLGR